MLCYMLVYTLKQIISVIINTISINKQVVLEIEWLRIEKISIQLLTIKMQSFLVVNSWVNQCALCVAERCFKLRWSWILSVRSLSLDIIVRKWRKNAILNWWWCWAKCAVLTADAHDTLKYLIREHACLLFMEFLSFSACNFSCNNIDSNSFEDSY